MEKEPFMGDVLHQFPKNASEEVRVSLTEYKGHKLIDLRIYYEPHCDWGEGALEGLASSSSSSSLAGVDAVVTPAVSQKLAGYPLVMGEENLIKLVRALMPAALIPLVNQHENWKLPEMLAENLHHFNDKQALTEGEVNSHFGYRNHGFQPFGTMISEIEYQESLTNPEAFQPTKTNRIGLEKILEICQALHFFRRVSHRFIVGFPAIEILVARRVLGEFQDALGHLLGQRHRVSQQIHLVQWDTAHHNRSW